MNERTPTYHQVDKQGELPTVLVPITNESTGEHEILVGNATPERDGMPARVDVQLGRTAAEGVLSREIRSHEAVSDQVQEKLARELADLPLIGDEVHVVGAWGTYKGVVTLHDRDFAEIEKDNGDVQIVPLDVVRHSESTPEDV